MASFPLIKLGYLLIRQISKPIANSIKERAKLHPYMRRFICIPIGQTYHRLETISKLALLGIGRPAKVTPLTEQMAVDLGSDVLSEFIVFGIAAALVVTEYLRSSASAKQKESDLMGKLNSVQIRIDELKERLDKQNKSFEEIQQMIAKYRKSMLGKIKEAVHPPKGKTDESSNVAAPVPYRKDTLVGVSVTDKLHEKKSSVMKKDDSGPADSSSVKQTDVTDGTVADSDSSLTDESQRKTNLRRSLFDYFRALEFSKTDSSHDPFD